MPKIDLTDISIYTTYLSYAYSVEVTILNTLIQPNTEYICDPNPNYNTLG